MGATIIAGMRANHANHAGNWAWCAADRRPACGVSRRVHKI